MTSLLIGFSLIGTLAFFISILVLKRKGKHLF